MKFRRLVSLLLALLLAVPAVTMLSFAAETGGEGQVLAAEIMSAKGGAAAVVTMTYDDGDYNTAVWLDGMYDQYDLYGSCMMIVKSNITDHYVEGNANAAKWNALFANGRLEPENHSMTHMVLPSESWAEGNGPEQIYNNTQENYQYELVDSLEVLRQYFPDYPLLTFASSNNTLSTYSYATDGEGNLLTDDNDNYIRVNDGGAEAVVKEFYYAVRQGQRGLQSLSPDTDHNGAGSWRSLYMMRFSDGTLETAKQKVDAAVEQGKWLITLCHGIGDDWGDFNKAEAEAFFAYVSEYVKTGEVWCATFSEATRYIRQRQNSTVSANKTDTGFSVTVTMADRTADNLPLDADVFNVPLTVKVEVPASCRSVRYTADGAVRFADTFIEGDRTYVYVDVRPNTTVQVDTVSYRTETVMPQQLATVVSDGDTITDALLVSAQEQVITDKCKKIFAKISISALAEDAVTILPLSVLNDNAGTLSVYGVTEADWSVDTLRGEEAPGNDPFGYGVDPDAVWGAAPIATLTVGGSGLYPVDLTAFVADCQAQGLTDATLIVVAEPAEEPQEFLLSFTEVDALPSYLYTETFETFDGDFVSRGFDAATYVGISTDFDHSGGIAGGSSFLMKAYANYQVAYLPRIIRADNTIGSADLGVSYTVSFYARSDKAGSFEVFVEDVSNPDVRPTSGQAKQKFSFSEEQLNQWIPFSFTFTVTQEMIDDFTTTQEANEDLSMCLCIKPTTINIDKADPVFLYVDDIRSERHTPSDAILVVPTESAAVGAEGSQSLSVLTDPTVQSPGIHKGYVSFAPVTGDLRGATLRFTVSGAGTGTFLVYGIPGALPDPLTYANAPASLRNEGLDPAGVYTGEPLYTAYAESGVVEIPVTAFVQQAADAVIFAVVSHDLHEPITLTDVSLQLHVATQCAVSLLPGASIRTAEPSGLRFESALDKNLYEQLVAAYDKVVFGTYIFPADRYEEFAAADMAGALRSEFRDVAGFEERDGVYTYYTSIVELKDQNYARAFGAVSYITVTKDGESRTMTTHYDPALNARSIRDVAAQVAESGELASMDEAQQTVVRGYLDAVVEVNADGTAVVPDGCTSPYTVRISDGKLIITATAGGDVGNIRSVIYNDTVYTRGWSIADGEWSAPLG